MTHTAYIDVDGEPVGTKAVGWRIVPGTQVDPVFVGWRETGFVWLPERGMGYYPVKDPHDDVYDDAYFEKYVEYAATPLGRELTRLRIDLVERWAGDVKVLDVGSGAGQFVESRGGKTWGYDINCSAAEWLIKRRLFCDTYGCSVPAATFWDSIEHIADVDRILANIDAWVFCSLPIFTGPEHVLRSKHYRKDEHCWYWTASGFVNWMAAHGFEGVEQNDHETKAGREDILSFAFRRAK